MKNKHRQDLLEMADWLKWCSDEPIRHNETNEQYIKRFEQRFKPDEVEDVETVQELTANHRLLGAEYPANNGQFNRKA